MSPVAGMAGVETGSEGAPSARAVLRRLFLTLFLRGRSSRGLAAKKAPTSVGKKLALTLCMYGAFGFMVIALAGQPLFVQAVYLHTMTFALLGMFVASSAGEVLFNKEEGDILLHRPIGPRTLLWTKVSVLLEVSLWIAGAFNLGGLIVGAVSPQGSWLFPVVHAVSVVLEAMFCVGCVVSLYQLCLRWFGRERLDGIITTAQVIVSVGAVLGPQVFPQMADRPQTVAALTRAVRWVMLLPPAWFAGLDDAIAGTGATTSWILAGMAVGLTGLILWVAFGKLAVDYETGIQRLSETVSRRREGGGRRWLDRLVEMPPLSWWLRDPVARASFLLTAVYLVRDRDVKLRLYPAIAPILVLPVVLLLQHGWDANVSPYKTAFTACYLVTIPLLGLSLIQYSQQWQAADIFRAAPIAGPASLCAGARRAILCVLTVPALLIFAGVFWAMARDCRLLALYLPGVLLMPVYALVPCIGGQAIPLSKPTDTTKGAGRGLRILLSIAVALPISGAAAFAWSKGWFARWMAGEAVGVAVVYAVLRWMSLRARWARME